MERSARSSGKRFDFEKNVSLVQNQGNSSGMVPVGYLLIALAFQERNEHCLCALFREIIVGYNC